MSNNLPDLKRDSAFGKIKKWIKNLLGIEATEDTTVEENENVTLKKEIHNSFKESIKFENDKDTTLQKKKKIIEMDKTKIKDLSNEELDEMIILYQEEIENKKEKLKRLKEKNSRDTK